MDEGLDGGERPGVTERPWTAGLSLMWAETCGADVGYGLWDAGNQDPPA